MKSLFNPEMIKKAIGVLIILLLIKIFWFAVEIVYFPAEGHDHAEKREAKPLYYRIRLTPNEAPAPIVPKKPKKQSGTIRDIVLLGIYNAPDQVVVTIKYKGKTKVLGSGESVNGFILKSAGNNYAVFEKDGKSYRVLLHEKKSKKGSIRPTASATVPSSLPERESDGGIVDAGDRKIVDRALIEEFTANPEDIYKNIGIKEVKRNGKIEGFRITFVRRGSPFAKLGLRRGDVLIAVNGQELDSYKTAFDAYRGIDDAQGLTLKIKRRNKEMELEYEIN